jgi:hypothetical protein
MVSKRLVWLALVVFLGAASAQAQMIADYRGHLWEVPGSGSSGAVAVGLVQTLASPLTSDMNTNEYTWVLDGLTTSSPVSAMASPGYVVFTGGRFTIYEDPNHNADYGINPPNGTAPTTFQDGTNYLSGTLSTLTMWWDPMTKVGNFEGTVNFDAGSHLAEVNPSVYQGWTFGGSTSSVLASIPAGYFQALDGEVFLAPLPVQDATWGKVKSLFSLNR